MGAFGKIPGMGDFLRVRVHSEPMMSFEQWIEQAMGYGDAKRGQAWPGIYGGGNIHAFVYRAPRAARSMAVLAGIVKPSRDAVGRRFPLVVFSPVLWYLPPPAAAEWGLTPLEDQQLAGLIMWVPGGLIYAGAALVAARAWITATPASILSDHPYHRNIMQDRAAAE